jgi:hypothetical protein
VMVSLYHQITGRFRDVFEFNGTLSSFIRDEYFGAATLQRFRVMWDTIIGQRNFLRISYEECQIGMLAVFRRLLDYYEISVTDEDLTAAIDKGSYRNMQKVEAEMKFPEPWLRYRNGFPKVREGVVGGHKRYFTGADLEFLDSVFQR